MYTNDLEQQIQEYQQMQSLCDITDAILKVLVDKQLTVGQSLRLLDNAKGVIESSVQHTEWGSPLTCEQAPNTYQWQTPELIAEINRRKGQDDP